MDDSMIIPIVISLGFFTLIGIIVVSSISEGRSRARMQAELRLRLLERADAGRAQAPDDWIDAESIVIGRSQVLRNVQSASVFFGVAIALSILI